MNRIEELDPYYLSYKQHSDEEDIHQAITDPTFDFFGDGDYLMGRPKAQIGTYVAEHDFNVPLITSVEQWQQALDSGVAMIRSESSDEYDGYRGLFRSPRIPRFNEAEDSSRDSRINTELTELALRGLREGQVSPVDYMKYLAGRYQTWPESLVGVLQSAQAFNVKPYLDIPHASLWQFTPGANVSIFGDPHVEGRYHVGFTPAPNANRGWASTGGFMIEHNQHAEPQRFRKHDEDFVAQPFIDTYEAIAALPLFDTEQRPVMELQMALDGTMHFLQYYKTGHRRDYGEPFDLPFSPAEDIKLDMVRGVTPPEGRDMRLFVTPKQFERAMLDEAVYCSLIRPSKLEVQLVSKLAGFVLHEAYISFQDNHFDSAPLFMPPLAAGFDGFTSDTNMDVAQRAHDRLQSAAHSGFHDYQNVTYFNLRVISNGHEIVLHSDWEPQVVAYDELRTGK